MEFGLYWGKCLLAICSLSGQETNNQFVQYGSVCIVFWFAMTSYKKGYQLSLTNPRDALHHGKRAANKGGRSV